MRGQTYCISAHPHPNGAGEYLSMTSTGWAKRTATQEINFVHIGVSQYPACDSTVGPLINVLLGTEPWPKNDLAG